MRQVALAGIALLNLSQMVGAQQTDDAIARFKSCLQREGGARPECLDSLSKDLAGGNGLVVTQPGGGTWVISETTSPVDYSPQITATIGSESTAKDAPSVFAIRCRGQRTELLVSTIGTWRPSPNGEFKVVSRINERPGVDDRWMSFAGGRGAIFKGDVIRFLRSLMEGGRLSISVQDWQGPAHDATFQMSGLDAVRRKISPACKWE